MNIKPFANFKTIVQVVVIAGVIIDSASVFSIWRGLNDAQHFIGILNRHGIPLEELGLESIIFMFQKMMKFLLIIFLLWDYVAYYYFWHFKNWARAYVMSIAIFYLVSCLFDFSVAQMAYAIFTIYYLKDSRKEFSPAPKIP